MRQYFSSICNTSNIESRRRPHEPQFLLKVGLSLKEKKKKASRKPPFKILHGYESLQAPVVQNVDNAIHRINLYPVDRAIGFHNTYPLDSDLSGG